MNDSLVVYIEKNILYEIDNEVIIKRFQNIKTQKNNCNVNFFILKVFLN
jgi:hypothetical protein